MEVEPMKFPVMEKMLQKQTELDFYNKAIERERLKQETKEMAQVRLSPIKGNQMRCFRTSLVSQSQRQKQLLLRLNLVSMVAPYANQNRTKI